MSAARAERIELARIAPQRWKNGAGLTREIASHASPGGAGFDWRVSLAEVTRDAPFSAFPGIDRCTLLLAGAGMRLASRDGRIDHALVDPLLPFRFDGAAAIDATLVGGACADFNVMTRRGVFTSEVVCHRGAAELPSAAATLLWCQAGAWRVEVGEAGEPHTLAPAQGLLWRAPTGRLGVHPLEGTAPALLAVRLCHDPAR